MKRVMQFIKDLKEFIDNEYYFHKNNPEMLLVWSYWIIFLLFWS